MSKVNTKGIDIGGSKEEIRRASNELSQRTERQAANLEETSAALDELTVAVRQTAEGAHEAAQRVTSVSAEANRSDQIVAQAIDAMGGIEHSSEEISKIIGVIDDIAFQTNLLALNAGVEAARAGESGKGFAVVAQEVRELAQRSAAAAKEIKDQISRSSGQVQNGVRLVGEAGEALKRISDQVKAASDIVGKIAHSASEQDTTLRSISSSLNQARRGDPTQCGDGRRNHRLGRSTRRRYGRAPEPDQQLPHQQHGQREPRAQPHGAEDAPCELTKISQGTEPPGRNIRRFAS